MCDTIVRLSVYDEKTNHFFLLLPILSFSLTPSPSSPLLRLLLLALFFPFLKKKNTFCVDDDDDDDAVGAYLFDRLHA